MKLYGSIKELLSAVFKKNSQEITLRPNQATTYTAARDVQLPQGDEDHVVVSRTSSDNLTNKTLTSPTLVTPALGTPSSGTLTNVTGLPIDGGTVGTLPVLRGGTGTTTSTGTGSVVLSNSPTLVTPALGTPSGVTLTNGIGLPIDGGTTGTLPVLRGGTGSTTSTGTGSVVLSNSPTLVTPALGTPSAVSLTNGTDLPIVGGTTGTLTVARGGTGATDATNAFDNLAPTTTKGDLVVHNGTDNIRLPVGADNQALVADSTQASGVKWASVGGDISNGGNSFLVPMVLGSNNSQTLSFETDGVTRITIGTTAQNGEITFPNATLTSANLAGVLTDETGSGSAVFANSPVLVTPNLGTPSSVTLTNGTGLPISTGVSGLGSGVATFLATPSSVNLASAVTDETGTGALVFANSPTLVTPALGTPSSVTLTNGTGLPISTGVSGLGSGVATFLGTPSSANLAAAVTGETGSGALVFGTSPTLDSPTVTTTLNAPAGTVSAPGVRWDTGTGIFRTGLDAIAFSSGGVQTGAVAASGQWTIGRAISAGGGGLAHKVSSGADTQLQIDSPAGSNSRLALQENGTTQWALQNLNSTDALQIINTSGITTGTSTQTGQWTFGPATGTSGTLEHQFQSSTGSAYINVNPVTSGQIAGVQLLNAGTARWNMLNNPSNVGAANSWELRNNGNTTVMQVSPSGTVTVGPSGFTGTFSLNNLTATTASAGSRTLPSNPVDFLVVNINGTDRKIPYYAN